MRSQIWIHPAAILIAKSRGHVTARLQDMRPNPVHVDEIFFWEIYPYVRKTS